MQIADLEFLEVVGAFLPLKGHSCNARSKLAELLWEQVNHLQQPPASAVQQARCRLAPLRASVLCEVERASWGQAQLKLCNKMRGPCLQLACSVAEVASLICVTALQGPSPDRAVGGQQLSSAWGPAGQYRYLAGSCNQPAHGAVLTAGPPHPTWPGKSSEFTKRLAGSAHAVSFISVCAMTWPH